MKCGMTWALVAGLGAGVLAWTLTGCEEATDTAGVSVSPSSVTLTASNNTAQFSATTSGDLALPLEWSVTDPGLGGISYHAGSNAVYTRTSASGDNIIIVVDQYGRQGMASVHQEAEQVEETTE